MRERSTPTQRTYYDEEEYHAIWYYDNNEESDSDDNSYLYQDNIHSEYDGYDNFNVRQCKFGQGDGGVKQRSKQNKQVGAQVHVYSLMI